MLWLQRSVLSAKPWTAWQEQGRRCEKTQYLTPWSEAPEASEAPKLTSNQNGDISALCPELIECSLVLAASGSSDQDVWGVYGCAFSWSFQWNYRRQSPTSAAGDIAVLVWVSFGSLRGPWSGCVRCLYGCAFSNGVLRGPGDTEPWKKLKVENLVSDSL